MVRAVRRERAEPVDRRVEHATVLHASTRRTAVPPLRRLVSVALWTVVVVCGFAYATSLVVPLWFQAHEQRLLVVTSGSMAPKFDAGDAVVMRRITDASQLKVGQVVSFWPLGSETLVTHRIVELRSMPVLTQDESTGTMVAPGGAGTAPEMRQYIITKGDANPVPDPNATPYTRVRGVILGVHHGWGWVLQWAGSATGRAIMLVPPLVALATLEILSMSDARRRARRARSSEERRLDALLLG
jgi:signal peptidase